MRLIILISLMSIYSYAQSNRKIVGGGCDGCELMFEGMPKNLNNTDTISAFTNSKSRLMVSGVIYQSDGKTPASGTILYYYQTNESGLYAPATNQTIARRHGGLRGWVKTNDRGEYRIFTIKPGPYPGRDIPAHIHMVIKERSLNEYYIDDIQFDDDPLLTSAVRKKNTNRAGSGVMITWESDGILHAERNITLGLHIPDYPGKQIMASGLSVGESCPAFEPIHFSGPDKGKSRCPMCSYGSDQGIIIWWNDPSLETLKGLLKNLAPLIAKHGIKKLRVFAVCMNSERKSLNDMTREMTMLSGQQGLQNCALLYIPLPEDLSTYTEYQLDLNAKNTVMIYRKRKVIDKFVNFNSTDPKALLQKLVL
jgi:protocatechuate 3,4-dioxygenase beta subunit